MKSWSWVLLIVLTILIKWASWYPDWVENHIDIADWIYEFINLSIPMQKVCSRTDKNGQACNQDALDALKKMEPEDEEKKINPIWKGLEKFKDLDN